MQRVYSSHLIDNHSKDQVLADFTLNQGQHIRIQLDKANKVYAQILDGKREVIQEIAEKNIYFGLQKQQGEAVIKGLREISPSKIYPVLHNGQLTLVLELKGAMKPKYPPDDAVARHPPGAVARPIGVKTSPTRLRRDRDICTTAKEPTGVTTDPFTLEHLMKFAKNTNDRQTETQLTIGPCSQSEQKIVQNRSTDSALEIFIDEALELLKKYPDDALPTIDSLQHALVLIECLCPEDKKKDLKIQRKHLTSILKSKVEVRHLKTFLRGIGAGDSIFSSIIGANLLGSLDFERKFSTALTKEQWKAVEEEIEKQKAACVWIGANASPIGAITDPIVLATTILPPILKQEIKGERLYYLITFREEALKCIERLSKNATQEPDELQDTLTLIDSVCPQDKKQSLQDYCEDLGSILRNEEGVKKLKTFLENII